MTVWAISWIFAAVIMMTGNLSAHAGNAAFVIEGRVHSIQDGDTLTLTARNGARFPIRLADLDAPEITHRQRAPAKESETVRLGQSHGRAAFQSLQQLTPIGTNVRAQCYEKDTYGRMICHIWAGERNVNTEQLRRGWAMLPRRKKWIRDHTSEPAQNEARLAKRGVWSERAPIHPQEWRRRCWREGDCSGAQE